MNVQGKNKEKINMSMTQVFKIYLSKDIFTQNLAKTSDKNPCTGSVKPGWK
jgi:hypothetical protein